MEDPLLELHVLADMLAHHRLGPVIQKLVRDPAKVFERRPVTRPEGDQVLGAGQPTERITGVPEHHVKAVQRQLQPRAGTDRLLVRPIDLRPDDRGESQSAPPGATSTSAGNARRTGGPCCSCPGNRNRGRDPDAPWPPTTWAPSRATDRS